MTETQHEHVQRDLAALQAAEKKFAAAKERLKEAEILTADAGRSLDLAHQKFRGTVSSSEGYAVPSPNGCSSRY